MISGSCLCGRVRFECDAPAERAHSCYCSRCQKSRGTAYAANLFVPLESFRWLEGESLVKAFQPPDAQIFTNSFCSECGANLPFPNPRRGVAVVPMGSVDGDPGIKPQARIFVGSKAGWVDVHGSTPQFERHYDSPRIDSAHDE